MMHEVMAQKRVGRGCVIWFTGMSGAGKTTLGRLLYEELLRAGVGCEYIDGDEVREFFNNDLGFTRQDRLASLRRIVYPAKLLAQHDVVTIVAAIAPYYEGRDFIRRHVENYIQIYVDVSVEKAMERDTKNHYKNHALGAMQNLIGLDDPYEVPRTPDLVIRAGHETVEESLEKIKNYLGGREELAPFEISATGLEARNRA